MAAHPQQAPRGTTGSAEITLEELQLAARNHGMPLEILRHDLTPLGLHYVLVHYDIPTVDVTTWRLRIDGRVRRPLELSLADVRGRHRVEQDVTMECAGNGRARLSPRALSQPWLHEAVGTARWSGTPLWPLLSEAGPLDDAVEVVFTGLDRGVEGGVDQNYERSLTLDEARRLEVVLAYEMNGGPLPPQHGFPLRLLVPGWYGMASVKWLVGITVTSQPFDGYQMTRAYRLRQRAEEAGAPLSRIAVRSLMVPPGIPDFLTRRRFVDSRPCELFGRAWSGHGAIARVEISDDGGRSWADATTDEPSGVHAWQGWRFTWTPRGAGDYELRCRATDAAGHTQPLEPAWNLGGYAVNAVQRVAVTVRS